MIYDELSKEGGCDAIARGMFDDANDDEVSKTMIPDLAEMARKLLSRKMLEQKTEGEIDAKESLRESCKQLIGPNVPGMCDSMKSIIVEMQTSMMFRAWEVDEKKRKLLNAKG